MAGVEEGEIVDEPSSTVGEPVRTGASATDPPRVVIAALLVAAGAIHLAMTPQHTAEWRAEGIAFAVAGVVQIVLAFEVVRPRPLRTLQVIMILDMAFVAAWLVTRTVGPPFGPEAGVRHELAVIDALCVIAEVMAIVLAAVVLTLPRRPPARGAVSRGIASVAGSGILVVATLVVASPGAAEHGDHEHGAADVQTHTEGTSGGHSHDVTELTDTIATDETHTTDHSHQESATSVPSSAATETTAGPDGHSHGTATSDAPVDDLGLSLLHNGEMSHAYGPDQPLDGPTREVLAHQLALTRVVTDRYPTLGDARAAGSRAEGAFNPGMGIHMSMPPTDFSGAVPPEDPNLPAIAGTLGDAEILHPANLLYGGSDDSSPIVGLMYYSMTADEPVGFAGPNDHWHTHSSLCLDMNKPGGGIGVLNVAEPTAEACADVGGFWYERTQWMVHVWTVPGYESNTGVFSDINAAITCPDGTYHMVPESQTDAYQLNHCVSNPA